MVLLIRNNCDKGTTINLIKIIRFNDKYIQKRTPLPKVFNLEKYSIKEKINKKINNVENKNINPFRILFL
tara:strand:- start:145 stop:354 length:210 start_codon:yes stop_codon:yes gene_type:complete